MEPDYSIMVFTIGRYKWQNSIEEARDLMWKDISAFLQMLFKNDYIAVIYDDDVDIVVIQYGHNENIEAWGVKNPVWVDLEDYEDYLFSKINKDVEEDGEE